MFQASKIDDFTAFHNAIKNRNEKEIFRLMGIVPLKKEDLNKKDAEGKTPLFDLIINGNKNPELQLDLIKKFIQQGADITIMSGWGTVLHVIAWNGFIHILKALLQFDKKNVQKILDVTLKDDTALQYAVKFLLGAKSMLAEGKPLKDDINILSFLEIIQVLVEEKASLRIPDSNKSIPLTLAIKYKDTNLIQLFLRADRTLIDYPDIRAFAAGRGVLSILNDVMKENTQTNATSITSVSTQTTTSSSSSRSISTVTTATISSAVTSTAKTETKDEAKIEMPSMQKSRGIFDVLYTLQQSETITDKRQCQEQLDILIQFGYRFAKTKTPPESGAVLLMRLMTQPSRMEFLLKKQVLFARLFFERMKEKLVEEGSPQGWLIQAIIIHNTCLEKDASKEVKADEPEPQCTSQDDKIDAAKAYFLVGKIELGLEKLKSIIPGADTKLQAVIKDLLIRYSTHTEVLKILLSPPFFEKQDSYPLLSEVLLLCKKGRFKSAQSLIKDASQQEKDIFNVIICFFSGEATYLQFVSNKQSNKKYADNYCLINGHASYTKSQQEAAALFAFLKENLIDFQDANAQSLLEIIHIINIWNPDFMTPVQGSAYAMFCMLLARNYNMPAKESEDIELRINIKNNAKYVRSTLKIIDEFQKQLFYFPLSFFQTLLVQQVCDTGFTVGDLLIKLDKYAILKNVIEVANERGIDISANLHALLPIAREKDRRFVELLENNISQGYMPPPAKPIEEKPAVSSSTKTPSASNADVPVKPSDKSAKPLEPKDEKLNPSEQDDYIYRLIERMTLTFVGLELGKEISVEFRIQDIDSILDLIKQNSKKNGRYTNPYECKNPPLDKFLDAVEKIYFLPEKANAMVIKNMGGTISIYNAMCAWQEGYGSQAVAAAKKKSGAVKRYGANGNIMLPAVKTEPSSDVETQPPP